MSIISVKCTEIQYLQFCVCAENVIYSFKNLQNCCHQSCFFWPRYAPNRLSAGAMPQTRLGELTALPRPSSYFRGGPPGEGERERGEGREEEGRGKKGREGEGRGGDEINKAGHSRFSDGLRKVQCTG